jgi:hypothetical protein
MIALFGLVPHRPLPASHRFLPILGVCLLGACAHAPRAHDADLAGHWEGTIAPHGSEEGLRPARLRLDLVVTDGQVTGTGELLPSGTEYGDWRCGRVLGEFRRGRAVLTFEPEGMYPHTLHLRLTDAGELDGSMDQPGRRDFGARPGQIYPRVYPLRVILVRPDCAWPTHALTFPAHRSRDRGRCLRPIRIRPPTPYASGLPRPGSDPRPWLDRIRRAVRAASIHPTPSRRRTA